MNRRKKNVIWGSGLGSGSGSGVPPCLVVAKNTASIFGFHVSSESEFDRCRSAQQNVRSVNMAFVSLRGAFSLIFEDLLCESGELDPRPQTSRPSLVVVNTCESL